MTAAKKEVDFNGKIVSARGGPRAASVAVSHAAEITQWQGKPLPADQTWHLVHYGKSMRVVNQYGEERDGEGKKAKMISLVMNSKEVKEDLPVRSPEASTTFDFAAAFAKIEKKISDLSAEVRQILATDIDTDAIRAEQQKLSDTWHTPRPEQTTTPVHHIESDDTHVDHN